MDRIRALEVRMDRALAKITSTLQALARSGLRPISEKGMNPRKSLRTTHGGRYEVKFDAQRFSNDRRDLPVERPSIRRSTLKPRQKVRSACPDAREVCQCPVHCMNRFAALEEVRDTMVTDRECIVEPAAKASYKQALLKKAADIFLVKKPKKGVNPQNRKAVYASTQRGWWKDRTKLVQKILEGKSVLEEAKPPPEEVLTEWESVFCAPSVEDGRDPVAIIDPMEGLMNEATIEESSTLNIQTNPGRKEFFVVKEPFATMNGVEVPTVSVSVAYKYLGLKVTHEGFAQTDVLGDVKRCLNNINDSGTSISCVNRWLKTEIELLTSTAVEFTQTYPDRSDDSMSDHVCMRFSYCPRKSVLKRLQNPDLVRKLKAVISTRRRLDNTTTEVSSDSNASSRLVNITTDTSVSATDSLVAPQEPTEVIDLETSPVPKESMRIEGTTPPTRPAEISTPNCNARHRRELN
ncbi:unnamed protein product [Lepeophtheirus salmonis]|uniref:(salmon louse) hypothetical protein n=1 Tax=Lepeophtheirus salmonis TaxID=72036 RepID=A0A7R8D575_LEPSM|nr:unnamed protein product [Lepeophtheirus salmonis]CAF3031814.1 unnamed protein product [Lepeophtheirus salmonis]